MDPHQKTRVNWTNLPLIHRSIRVTAPIFPWIFRRGQGQGAFKPLHRRGSAATSLAAAGGRVAASWENGTQDGEVGQQLGSMEIDGDGMIHELVLLGNLHQKSLFF